MKAQSNPRSLVPPAIPALSWCACSRGIRGAKKPLLFKRNGESGGYADLSEAYPQLAGNGGFPFESFSWRANEGCRRGRRVLRDAARVFARIGARGDRSRASA